VSIPPTCDESVPSTCDESVPLTCDESVPSTCDEFVPPTFDESVPPTCDESVPPICDESVPPTCDESIPPTCDESLPPTCDESSELDHQVLRENKHLSIENSALKEEIQLLRTNAHCLTVSLLDDSKLLMCTGVTRKVFGSLLTQSFNQKGVLHSDLPSLHHKNFFNGIDEAET